MSNITTIIILLIFATSNIYSRCGELWFFIDDTNTNYKIVAERIFLAEPLFGANFMELGDNHSYDEVTSDQIQVYLLDPPYDFLLGFDYLRDTDPNNPCWPNIGEGKLKFTIYRDEMWRFEFIIDLVHSNTSPDINFFYSPSTGLFARGNGYGMPEIPIPNEGYVNSWEILQEERNIEDYCNNIELTNLIDGVAENDVKTLFYNAGMGFPDNDVQLGVEYNPGIFKRLWRGVNYGVSTTHSSYTKNGVIYNFRNWDGYTKYTTSSTLKVLENTNKFMADFFPTIPLMVANNLEGGSSNNDYEIIWQTPDPDITTTWQYGIAFNAFNYIDFEDACSATASNQFQALSTTWWFHHWDNGSTNSVRPNIQVTAPTTITAYYKGNLRSNDQNGVKNPNQRKMIRTDNGQYHVVYESMGTVWYTYSLTSNLYGAWGPEEQLHYHGKNPAIDYDGNSVAIVFEEYDPQVGGNAKIYLVTYESGMQVFFEAAATYSNSYYGNAKPVVSYTQYEIFIAYRTYPAGAIKERTLWSDGGPTYDWSWGDSTDIPGTNTYCVNPTVTGRRGPALARIYIAYESLGAIYFKRASRVAEHSWDFAHFNDGEPVILSASSGFNINRYPVISLSDNSLNRYLMVSWQGIYDSNPTNPLPKIDGTKPLYREASVVKTGYETGWSTPSSFSNNVDYTNNSSLNTAYGSVMTWSESDGQYSKYVVRRNTYGYDPIQSLSDNGIHTLVSNGNEFGSIKAMVFDNSTDEPYFINRCTNDFTYIPDGFGKITEDGTIDISYGRSGIIGKNGIEFVFNIGDVLLNGETIKFIERNDTIPIASIEELNNSVRTDTLSITQQSELIFSDYYYVVNGERADSLLSDEFSVTFKCELVKLSTGEAAGLFEQVNYNKTNLDEYGTQGYLVDCSGIEAGEYYLRLTASVNEEVGLSLSDIQMDNVVLEKSNLNVRNFKGESIPVEYAFEQNYPNPFNPSTTITYQIPKDGMVTLKVYDILGSEVATLVNEEKITGRYEVNFDASSIATGVYVYRLNVNDYVSVKKMILLK